MGFHKVLGFWGLHGPSTLGSPLSVVVGKVTFDLAAGFMSVPKVYSPLVDEEPLMESGKPWNL